VAAGSAGLTLAPSVLSFDLWVLLAVTLACLPIFVTGREISRWEGVVFLLYYLAYTAYLVLAARSSEALPMLSTAMFGFVLPLTVLGVLVSVLRTPHLHQER
jgi:cation:H+ antiporter